MRAYLLLLLGGCETLFPLDDVPCATAIGHDEDGDGIDDACDRCPAVADALDPDGDGDGIGDACDPQPDVGCETRLKFEGFGAQPDDLVITAQWFVGDDDLVQQDPSADTELAHFPATSLFDDVVFRADVVITGFDFGEQQSSFEIGSGGAAVGDEPSVGYACAVHRSASTPELDVRLLDENPDVLIESRTFTGNLADSHTFELVNSAAGTLSCLVAGPRSFGKVESVGVTPRSMGEIFLFADDIAARVHWIDVIQNCPR